jgi:hypothetical protein
MKGLIIREKNLYMVYALWRIFILLLFKLIYMNGDLWYPLAYKWARFEHHRYGDEWKNLMERAIQALISKFL